MDRVAKKVGMEGKDVLNGRKGGTNQGCGTGNPYVRKCVFKIPKGITITISKIISNFWCGVWKKTGRLIEPRGKN